MSNCSPCYPRRQQIYIPGTFTLGQEQLSLWNPAPSSPHPTVLLGVGQKRRWGGVGGGQRGRGSGMSGQGGWSEKGAEAGRRALPPGLGEVQEGWQSGHLGSCPSSPSLAPHLRRPAGPLTLTSKTLPQASLSSVLVQAIVSLMEASAPTSVLSLGSRASALTSYSPFFTQQVGGASSLPSLTAWNEFWPPAP